MLVLGGLVDHKPKPGAALAVAKACGMRSARLPLDGIVTLRKPSLTCLACFQILAGLVQTGSWAEAVRGAPAMRCAPMRKYVCWAEGCAPEEAEGRPSTIV